MTPRWAIERNFVTMDRDLLQIVEVYAPGETKEVVKQENRKWTHRRELLFVTEMEESFL